MVLVGVESRTPSLSKNGLDCMMGAGKGDGKGTPRLDFEPRKLENGDINGNKEIRGAAGWDCL